MSDANETSMDEAELLGARIKHILTIYPVLSATMLQAALGPQTKSDSWRPVLEDMIANNIVYQDSVTLQSPIGRYNSYDRYMLADISEAVKNNALA